MSQNFYHFYIEVVRSSNDWSLLNIQSFEYQGYMSICVINKYICPHDSVHFKTICISLNLKHPYPIKFTVICTLNLPYIYSFIFIFSITSGFLFTFTPGLPLSLPVVLAYIWTCIQPYSYHYVYIYPPFRVKFIFDWPCLYPYIIQFRSTLYPLEQTVE